MTLPTLTRQLHQQALERAMQARREQEARAGSRNQHSGVPSPTE